MPLRVITMIIFFMLFSEFATAEGFHHSYSMEIRIVNTLGDNGYFGTCRGSIQPGGETLCSIPQEVSSGPNRIFVPAYQQSYPVFALPLGGMYTCGTQNDPLKQLSFSPQDINGKTLYLASYIKDKDNNNIAILCVLQETPAYLSDAL